MQAKTDNLTQGIGFSKTIGKQVGPKKIREQGRKIKFLHRTRISTGAEKERVC